jgi:ribosome-binding protein aMBF1 (putative translation factor)
MDKPKPLTEAELKECKRKKGKRTGHQKNLYVSSDFDKVLVEYSKKLNMSQSEIVEKMMIHGIDRFEKMYGLEKTGNIPKERDRWVEDMTRQINERYRKEIAKAKEKAAQKATELSDAYMRRIIHDYSDGGGSGWERA